MSLADQILSGELPASAAIGHPEIYDALNAGANGRLPFLGSSYKIDKGTAHGVLGTVLYMMPAMSSGREACVGRSEGCTAACLAEDTGRMSMKGSQRARRRRHASFFADRARFLAHIADEIGMHRAKAIKLDKACAVRLDGTTGLPWHLMRLTYNGVSYPNVHAIYPDVNFYEYTKRPLKLAKTIPANLHFTFSVSEREDANDRATEWLNAGYGAAVVTFTKRHEIPATFDIGGVSYPTVDGDYDDLRYLDPRGHVVILSAKGRAKTDTSGFVRHP